MLRNKSMHSNVPVAMQCLGMDSEQDAGEYAEQEGAIVDWQGMALETAKTSFAPQRAQHTEQRASSRCKQQLSQLDMQPKHEHQAKRMRSGKRQRPQKQEQAMKKKIKNDC